MERLLLHVMESALRRMQQSEFDSGYGYGPGGPPHVEGWIRPQEHVVFTDPFGNYRIRVHTGWVRLTDSDAGIAWTARMGVRTDDLRPALRQLDIDFGSGDFEHLGSAANRRAILYQCLNALCQLEVYGVEMPPASNDLGRNLWTLKGQCDAARRSGHRRKVRTASHYIEQILGENRATTVHPANRASELRYIQVAVAYLGAQADGRSGRKAVEEQFCPGRPGQTGSLLSRAQQAGYLTESMGRGPGAVRSAGPKFDERWLAG